jgi:hypothetical protein
MLDTVEVASGLPAIVQEERALNVLATVRMARGDAPCHIVFLNPTASAFKDYLICFQCACVLRTFSVPRIERLEFAATEIGRQKAGKELETTMGTSLKHQIGNTGMARMRDQFFNGVMLQLRSMPLSLRVDAWLQREYPALTAQQEMSISRQLEENAMSLKPEIKRLAPPTIYQASLRMNAAFATFWATTLQQELHVLPYKASGYLDIAKRLVALLDTIPDDAKNDRMLIDAWGRELKLTDWFAWKPFDSAT